MAIVITIDGEDKTKLVDQKGFSIEKNLTHQVDKFRFRIKKAENSDRLNYRPRANREVTITNGGTKIFGGIIVRVSQYLDVKGLLNYDCECEDYSRLLNRKKVADTFENQTVNSIIASLISDYTSSGITGNNVDCTKVIAYIGFNYLSVGDCLTELADLVNYDWYIDEDKDIHFFARDAKNAPFDIQDSDGSYLQKSLIIKEDTTQLKNVIYIRGGEYLADTFTTQIEADGVRSIYDIPYKYQGLSCTLSGLPLSVGLDYIDSSDDYDVLWNFQEKILRWKDADKPSLGAAIRVGGRPYLPVRVKVRDQDSVDSMVSAEGGDGEHEFLIIDNSIKSREGARERARAELDTYKISITEASFQTYTDGLNPGQRIRINSTSHDIDDYYIINRVSVKMFTHNTFIYTISVVTTKTFGIIEWMQQRLIGETKQITINADEVIDLVEALDETVAMSETFTYEMAPYPQNETISMAETFTAQSIDYDVDFVLGDYTPTGTKRVFILDGSPLEDVP